MPIQELIERWCRDNFNGTLTAGGVEVLDSSGAVTVGATDLSPELAEVTTTFAAPDWLVTRELDALPSLQDLADGMSQQRHALLHCDVVGTTLVSRMKVYLDGLTRQELMTAIAEVVQAFAGLQRSVAALDGQRGVILETQKAIAEAQRQAAAYEQQFQVEAATPVPPEVATPAPEPLSEPDEILPPPPPVDAGSACANCGNELAGNVRFCARCGTPVNVGAPTTPPVASPLVCKNCGASLAEGARFCVSCGTPAS